ncbi:MAG: cupin domain-containing protein [Burkholderiales bacterium]|nr:cupin domain-containing protein [Burkholderiales bacterium]
MSHVLPMIRRVVTADDAAGRSRFLEDAPLISHEVPGRPGLRWARAWATGPVPAPLGEGDRSAEVHGIMPPAGGSVVNIIDFPPEPRDSEDRRRALEDMERVIRQAGSHPEDGVTRRPDGPHPSMHQTDTIDYAFVLSGEIVAILDGGETVLKAGDVLVQRGTNHAWSNRSGAYCRVAFVLIAAAR